jgi:hypothetical protein
VSAPVRLAPRTAAAAALALAAACGSVNKPRPATAPRPARASVRLGDAQYRFEILRARDTTFTFIVRAAEWVRPGQRGIVVDPRRHDTLVARFSTLARRGDSVTALVTGQTADVTPEHVALLSRPQVGTLRQRSFWLGLLAGAVAGGAAGAAVR